MKIAFMILLLALTGPVQKPKPQPPIFHGLKLGKTLGSQLKDCGGKFDGIEACYDDLGDYKGDSGKHSMLVFEDETSYAIVVLLSTTSDDVSDGTIEVVSLEYQYPKEVNSVLSALKGKYGQGSCSTEEKRTGIGLPIKAMSCAWQPSWGLIVLDSPGSTLNDLTVTASTTKILDYQGHRQEEDYRKKKSEF
jgi:hypothetical protein